MKRTYLKLHLWLKTRCERLTLRQRRIIFFSISTIYFLSSLGLIVSAFIPEKDSERTDEMEVKEYKIAPDMPELIDTPIRKDSLYGIEFFEQSTT